MIKTYSLIASAALLGLGGYAAYTQFAQSEQCFGTTVAGGAIGGPFELVDETGATVTETDIITEPTLIYFGYTFCPDVCPIDAARNAAAVQILADDGIQVRPVFITIDPKRDTVEVVGDYTENFHERMIGLTGTEEQIQAAARAYRVVYSRADEDPEFYLMNHSVFSYLVTPEDGFVAYFRREDSPQVIADQISCFLA